MMETIISPVIARRKGILTGVPRMIASQNEIVTAKSMMTRVSIATVTPQIISVNGPLAFVSVIIAIAVDGDRATAMTPNMAPMANRWAMGFPTMKGISGCPTKIPHFLFLQKTDQKAPTLQDRRRGRGSQKMDVRGWKVEVRSPFSIFRIDKEVPAFSFCFDGTVLYDASVGSLPRIN